MSKFILSSCCPVLKVPLSPSRNQSIQQRTYTNVNQDRVKSTLKSLDGIEKFRVGLLGLFSFVPFLKISLRTKRTENFLFYSFSSSFFFFCFDLSFFFVFFFSFCSFSFLLLGWIGLRLFLHCGSFRPTLWNAISFFFIAFSFFFFT